MGYSKLFPSIIHSTVWRAGKDVQITWVTMLAMCDRDGLIEASLPGLADAAKLTLEETEAALLILMAPDPHSRTPDNEGRRVESVDGGWLLLNYEKYRDKEDLEERRRKDRERQARRRERLSRDGHVMSRDVTENPKNPGLSSSSISSATASQKTVAPDVIPVSPPKKRKKKNQTKRPGTNLLQCYYELHLELKEHAPTVAWKGRDLNAAEQLLKGPPARTVEELKPQLRAYLEMDDKYVAEAGWPFSLFPSSLQKLQAARHRPRGQLKLGDPTE